MKQKQPRLGTNNEECTQDHNKPSNFKIHHFTYNSAYRSNQTEKKEKKQRKYTSCNTRLRDKQELFTTTQETPIEKRDKQSKSVKKLLISI